MKYFSLLTVLGLLGCFNVNAMQKHEISKEDEKKPKLEVHHYNVQDVRRLEEFYAHVLQAEWSVYNHALFARRQLIEGKVDPNALLYSDMIIDSMRANLDILKQKQPRPGIPPFMVSGQITPISPNTQFHFIPLTEHPPFFRPLVSQPSDNRVVNKQTQETKDTQKSNKTTKTKVTNRITPSTVTEQILPIPLPGVEQRQAQLHSLMQQAKDSSKADQSSTEEEDSNKK